MNERLTQEWIQNVTKLLKPTVKKVLTEKYRKINSHPCMKECKRKYEKSEKGKLARKRADRNRANRERNTSPWRNERKMMRDFIKECPEGYEIDHIIPLAKGGYHTLCNLQWVSRKVNQLKHTKILLKKEDFPQCVISIRDGIF